MSYGLAMEVFTVAKEFPKEEKYSLTSQLIRSSRSIPANIAEGWAKRVYEDVFKRHLVDAIGSVHETVVWLDFARDCRYLSDDKHVFLLNKYEEVSKMLTKLHESWTTFRRLTSDL